MLLNSELNEVEAKIAALETVKEGLNRRLVGLQEEELELNDEYEGVSQSVALQRHRRSMPGSNTQEAAAQAAGGSSAGARVVSTSRRSKGPLFLPSEHEELPSGVAFMTLTGHTAPISALDFSEPYGTLVSASADDSVRVWDLTAGAEVGRLRGHTGAVRCLQVEDELCITGSADSTLRLWDLRKVEDYETRLQLAEQGDVSYQNLPEPGTATDTDDPGADDPYSPCMRTLEGHSNAVTALYFDDNCLVTGASDKTLRQWDLNTGQCILTMDILWAISNPTASQSLSSSTMLDSGLLPKTPRASAVFGSPTLLSSSTFGGPAGVGNGGINPMTGNFSHPTPAYADGSWEMYQDFVGGVQFWGYALASGSGDGAVRMWDMRTGQAHRTLLGHIAPVTCLQFDETYVVSGSLDKTIRVSPSTRRVRAQAPKADLLTTRILQIWDLRTGAISDTIKYEYPVTALQFDSRKIIAATGENGVDVSLPSGGVFAIADDSSLPPTDLQPDQSAACEPHSERTHSARRKASLHGSLRSLGRQGQRRQSLGPVDTANAMRSKRDETKRNEREGKKATFERVRLPSRADALPCRLEAGSRSSAGAFRLAFGSRECRRRGAASRHVRAR